MMPQDKNYAFKAKLKKQKKNEQNKYTKPGIIYNKLDRKATQKALLKRVIPKEAIDGMSTDNMFKTLGNDRNIVKWSVK